MYNIVIGINTCCKQVQFFLILMKNNRNCLKTVFYSFRTILRRWYGVV
jgi:hypothetical protein